MDSVKFELDGGHNGWRCSGCGLLVDAIGRPIMGTQIWEIKSNGIAWIENKPRFKFCPKCGRKVDERNGY